MTETVSFTQTPPGPPPAISGPMALVPAFDAIELLPDIAADKMRMLRQRALDAHSLIPEFESLRDAVAARTNAQARLCATAGPSRTRRLEFGRR